MGDGRGRVAMKGLCRGRRGRRVRSGRRERGGGRLGRGRCLGDIDIFMRMRLSWAMGRNTTGIGLLAAAAGTHNFDAILLDFGVYELSNFTRNITQPWAAIGE